MVGIVGLFPCAASEAERWAEPKVYDADGLASGPGCDGPFGPDAVLASRSRTETGTRC